MRKQLTEEGYANIFANLLARGLETLVEPDGDHQVYGVGGLSAGLMEAACNNLRIRAEFEGAFVLRPERNSEQHITPEELSLRLRADPESHLVIFIPEEFRDQADRAFSPTFFTPVDTFRSLEEMEGQMIARINRVPVYKRVATLWSLHAIARIPILKRLDYLINLISLCLSHEEMGMFFHKLDLIPDRAPDATGNFSDRLARNFLAVTCLCDRSLAPAARVAALDLVDADLAARLTALVEGLGDDVTPQALASAVFQAEYRDDAAGLSF
ncbi:MAG: hypothetical protein ACE5IM_04340, partial [Nitrospinota bacterium]